MMTRKSLALGALATAALLSIGTMGAAPAAHAAAPQATLKLTGVLQAGFATTTPTTIQILSASSPTPISVTVNTNTTVVRRYNGASSLAEFSPGDRLGVEGTMSNGVMNATIVKDFTIQAGFTFNVGTITNIKSLDANTTQLAVRVVANVHHKVIHPFHAGQFVNMNVSNAMTVTLSDGSAGRVSDLAPGLQIATVGVYNRESRTFISVARMRVVTPSVGQFTGVSGWLQAAPSSATPPATLTLKTFYGGIVNVTVPATTTLRSRSGVSATLSQFHQGDWIHVLGTFNGLSNGAGSITASLLRDFAKSS